MKQFPQAIATIQKMAAKSTKSAELDMLLAEAYEQNKQTQEAIDALRKAVQLAPENEDGFVDLAALCIKYEAYDIGMQVIQTGLQNHPKSDRLMKHPFMLPSVHFKDVGVRIASFRS